MPVGHFASLSGQSLWEVRWDTPEHYLPNIKSLSGSKGENFSLHLPCGDLREVILSVLFQGNEVELGSLISWDYPQPVAAGWSGKPAHP